MAPRPLSTQTLLRCPVCGIAGIVSLRDQPVFLEELRSMCAALVQRGPDDEGTYLGDGAGLAMRRLSIIDLETGHQPVANEDGSIWVVLNGEIYNYQQLRCDLERRGHRFATGTDTETIVHLYEDRGDECVQALRGMFAFALWDERRRRLLVARDRIGIKPLYYGLAAGRLLFASELKALLQLPEVERRLNWNAVAHLLSYGTTPRDESIVEGVRKLEPGHRLLMEQGREPVVERYWELKFRPDGRRPEEDTLAELRAKLHESIRYHLVSDVPVGAFLSGGIDSSSVAASMAMMTTHRIKTFSIGFREQEFDELPYARLVAARFGTDHHELVLEPDALDLLDHFAWDLDEPLGDPSAIPTYLVSRLAGRHVKVVLSGDGGDELFGGYDKYVVEARDRPARLLPPAVRSLLARASAALPEDARGKQFLEYLSKPNGERYLYGNTLFRREHRCQLLTGEARKQVAAAQPERSWLDRLRAEEGHWLSTLQDLDFRHYLPLDILTKVDRMTMAHSLEARVPLLDHTFVEFAATIPADWKLRRGRTKYVFVKMLRGWLPDEILDRPKKGFGVPLNRWFRGPLRHVLREVLLSEACRARGIFDEAYVQRLIARHENGRPLDLHLWTIMSFELWCRTFLDRSSRAPVTAAAAPHAVPGKRTAMAGKSFP
ncbi:MAG TPA: asparagine synthase (glutamine-hydrolyzing) [Nitrospira sp.]|nr:asparagine synthase (glutamine-hydrolyzing) [Nitrospira sp.]